MRLINGGIKIISTRFIIHIQQDCTANLKSVSLILQFIVGLHMELLPKVKSNESLASKCLCSYFSDIILS